MTLRIRGGARRIASRSLLVVFLVLSVLATGLPNGFTPTAAGAATIAGTLYVHDDLGRLTGMATPDGAAAAYQYDAVGNVKTIKRFTATQVSVLGMAKGNGSVGSTVTIWGTNFNATASSNTVKFNGTGASVSAATANKLTVKVPSGATTGTISVTNSAGTAASLMPFTVKNPQKPAITSFTPEIATQGNVVTINGSGFSVEPLQNIVKFGTVSVPVLTATATKLTVEVPPNVVSGFITVTTVVGSTKSAKQFFGLEAAYDPANVEKTASITMAEGPREITITKPGAMALVTFEGERGKRVIPRLSGSDDRRVWMWAPDGSATWLAWGDAHDPIELISGTYTIAIAMANSGAGKVSVDITDAPADVIVATTIDNPNPVTVNMTNPYGRAVVTFPGVAGQRVSINTSGLFYGARDITVIGPSGVQISTRTFDFIDPFVLAETGTYSVIQDPYGDRTSQFIVDIFDVKPDPQAATTINAPMVKLDSTVPGQNFKFTFPGTAGQKVTITTANENGIWWSQRDMSILAPSGKRIGENAGFYEPFTLPETGTYTVISDPVDIKTGTQGIAINTTAPDLALTTTLGAAEKVVNITAPGQNAKVTFTGTAGQRVGAVTSGRYSDRLVTITAPDGTSLGYDVYGGFEPFTLPVTGTYTVTFDPNGEAVGQFGVRLWAVPADKVFNTSIPDGAVNVGNSVAMQNVAVNFNGTANQNVGFRFTQISGQSCSFTVNSPDGSLLLRRACMDTSEVLPATGAYKLVIDYSGEYVSTTATLDMVLLSTVAASKVSYSSDFGGRVVLASYTEQVVDGEDKWRKTMGLVDEAAPAGVTALSGEVRGIDGAHYKDVSVSVAGHYTQTDRNGRFLLTDVPAGHQILVVDGVTAYKPGRKLGHFEMAVDIADKTTTKLSWTVFIPEIDQSTATAVGSTTANETVVKTSRVPGLEVHIPAGVSITDHEGHPVNELSLTPIPVDHPPFPLPGDVRVPIYFTVQPGNARVSGIGAQIYYPNYYNALPGARIPFWWYDKVEGWKIYGQGSVSADGKQIIPDADTRVHEFSGAMVGGPAFGTQPGFLASFFDGLMGKAGDPVELVTGQLTDSHTDLALPGPLGGISVNRNYRTGDDKVRSFGVGTSLDYDMFLYSVNLTNFREIELVLAGGQRLKFTRETPGFGYRDALLRHTGSDTQWENSILYWNGTSWDLTLTDGTVYNFADMAGLMSVKDRFGNRLNITRIGGTGGPIGSIMSSNGTWVRFGYDDNRRITSASDNAGRKVSYAYDTAGHLISVTDVAGRISKFTYDSAGRMLTAADARGVTYMSNVYDAKGRVGKQTLTDGAIYSFAYVDGANGLASSVKVTNPNGSIDESVFDASGNLTKMTAAVGKPEQAVSTIERSAGSRRVASQADAAGRKTSFEYDNQGRITKVNSLVGKALASSSSITYSMFGTPATVTDQIGRTSRMEYTSAGLLAKTTSPTGAVTTFQYDNAGQLIVATDALGNKTFTGYDGDTMVSTTDALGRKTERLVDSIGRVVRTTDSSGVESSTVYDALNQPLRSVNGLDGATVFTYDANGNVTSFTDPSGSKTTYEYDNSDRLTKSTDPLGRISTSGYNTDGSVAWSQNALGTKATFTYDALGRQTSVGWGIAPNYELKTDTTYDGAGRVTKVVDSASGTATYAYDDRDRLLSETLSTGAVNYAYDNADRTTSMTLSGQPAVTYGYDNNDNLTSITRGSLTASFAYDALGRTTNKTLVNGTSQNYSYDAASQLTNIDYMSGATKLGNIGYQYDVRGIPSMITGTYSKTSLPAALGAATYDKAQQLTAWDATTFAYDAVGNVTREGTRNYTYNARGQMTSSGTSTYTYDVAGRRASKVTAGVTTGYRYDGDTAIQELRNGAVSTNMLVAGTDETIARIGPAGDWYDSILDDRQGSTVALSRKDKVSATTYAYGPYGESTSAGAASSNATQYTGRENDGDGLYFYRARYYSPKYGRFLSQDPAGLAGGINPYAYVNNSPLTATDPTGETPALLGACAGGAAISGGMDVVGRALSGRKFNAGHALGAAVRGCGEGMASFGLSVGIGKGIQAYKAFGASPATVGVTGTAVVKYDANFALGHIVRGGKAKASELIEFGQQQGWSMSKSPNGPRIFKDQNGVKRLTIKSGSGRAPGSEGPHVEMRNAANQRIDAYGNPAARRSILNHQSILWDL